MSPILVRPKAADAGADPQREGVRTTDWALTFFKVRAQISG